MFNKINRSLLVGAAALSLFAISELALRVIGVEYSALSFITPSAHANAIPGIRYKSGYVLARSLILDDAGNPIYSEYDVEGKIVQDLSVAAEDIDTAFVISGEAYRMIVKAFDAISEKPEAEGAYTLTAQDYNSGDLGTIDVREIDAEGTISVAIPKPTLLSSTRSVLLRNNNTIIDPRTLPTASGPILLQAPIDLTPASLQRFGEQIKSVLLNKDGQVLHTSTYDIGLKAGFFQNREDTQGFLQRKPGEDIPTGPIKFVPVDAGLAYGRGVAYTDEEGKYRLAYYLSPCPNFMYTADMQFLAKLSFTNFNPEARNPRGDYYFSKLYTDSCIGFGYSPPGYDLAGLMTQIAVKAIVATLATPVIRTDFFIDTMMLNGQAQIINSQGSPMPIGGETRYTYTAFPFTPMAPVKLDLDADRKSDWTVLNPDNTVDVFLGGQQPAGKNTQGQYIDAAGNVINADLTKIADRQADFQHQGLLESLTLEDFKETDLYVYRQSTDQLVAKIEGLEENRIIAEDSRFYYRLAIPGRHATKNDISTRDFELRRRGLRTGDPLVAWQRMIGSDPDLVGREVNFLRAGERVKLIAINRVTGYMGSVVTQMEAARDGRLDFPIDRIHLKPPNLKVRVERMYTVEAGLTKGKQREYQIGFEGAALKTDTTIAIYTEWFDHDGSPLPKELEGYTGRLAKVTGPNSLDGGEVNTFEIKPGANIQVLRFRGDSLGSDHFYVHVSGYPEWRNPGVGAGDGPLQYRPKNYVPVKVPVLDENSTRQLRNAAKYAEQDGVTTVPDVIPAVYQWPYRPEMQFSVLDLNVQKINRKDAEEEILDILQLGKDDDTSTIPEISPADLDLSILYNLKAGANPVLQSIGYYNEQIQSLNPENTTGKEFVFKVGEDEKLATFGDKQSVQFTNLGHLSQLDPEDYLTVSLSQNIDSENVLWEFAFGLQLSGVVETYEVSADEPIVKLKAFIPGKQLNPPKSVTVKWEVQGPNGTLDNFITTSDDGIFSNILHTSRKRDDEYTVTARVIDTEDLRVEVGSSFVTPDPIKVVPGKPAQINLESDATNLPADTVSKTEIRLEAFDAHANKLLDGTKVSWDLDYSGQILNAQEELLDGKSKATYRVGGANLSSDVNVKIDEIEQSLTIEKTPLDVELVASSGSLIAGSGQSITLTANVDAVDGVPVEWNSTRGEIVGQSVISGGSATATLVADNSIGEAVVTVLVADQSAAIQVQHITTGSRYAEVEYAAIVGKATDGFVTVDTIDSIATHSYLTSTNLVVHGTPGEVVTLSTGGFYTPNAEPILRFPMDDIGQDNNGDSVVTDVVSGIKAKAFGTITVDTLNSFTLPGSSLLFDNGHLIIDPSPTLDVANNLFVNFKFKRTGTNTEQILVSKGNGANHGYTIKLIDGGTRLHVDLTTESGTYSATSAVTIEQDKWYIAGIRVRSNLLEVGVNQDRLSVPISGFIQGNGAGIGIGNLFDGNIDDLRIGEESTAKAIVLLAGSNLSSNVTIGADGTASIAVQATGGAFSSGQRVGLSIASTTTTGEIQTDQRLFADLAINVISSLLGIGAAHADPVAASQENGIAVVDEQSWGTIVEWAGKRFLGEPAFQKLKSVVNFIYQLSGLSDIVTLIKAVIALARGKTADIDGLEVTFAIIGVGITVAAVFTGGAAASLKFGLNSLKILVRELVVPLGLPTIVKTVGITFRAVFNVLLDFIKGSRDVALRRLSDYADAFTAIIKKISFNMVNFFFRTTKSVDELDELVDLYKLHKECVVVAAVPSGVMFAGYSQSSHIPFEGALFDHAMTALFGKYAYAASCKSDILKKLTEISADTVKFENTRLAASVAARMRHAALKLAQQGIYLSDDALDGLAEVAKFRSKGRITETLLKTLSPDEIEKTFTAVKKLADTLPSAAVRANANFDTFIKQLATRNPNGVRGAMHVIRDLEKIGVAKLEKFEFSFATLFTNRRVDVVLKSPKKHVEYKAWEQNTVPWSGSSKVVTFKGKVYTGSEAEIEFIKDILTRAKDSTNFEWVIHKGTDLQKVAAKMKETLGAVAKQGAKSPELHPMLQKALDLKLVNEKLLKSIVKEIDSGALLRSGAY